MEVPRNDTALSDQIDYKKIKSDWHVFNNQEDYDFKRYDKFCCGVARFAKKFLSNKKSKKQ